VNVKADEVKLKQMRYPVASVFLCETTYHHAPCSFPTDPWCLR